jgi:hypothetical protein
MINDFVMMIRCRMSSMSSAISKLETNNRNEHRLGDALGITLSVLTKLHRRYIHDAHRFHQHQHVYKSQRESYSGSEIRDFNFIRVE